MKWFEKVKNYLGQIKGAARIPLTYIIRNHLEVNDNLRNAEYGSMLECLIAITSLNGMHVEIDNTRVWQEVKALVIDGFGWSYIKRFEQLPDGWGAVLALCQQYEGGSSLLTHKNQAYASLKGAAYHGPYKAYTYQQYVALHQDAHNELEDTNEAVPETKIVADFLAGIRCPILQMGLNIVMSDPMKLSNFDVTQQFLGTLVAYQANHNRIKNDERGISTVETFKKSNKLKKGKGGKGTGGKWLEDRFYPKDEWNILTQE
jgi:hypothetical protein